MAHDPVNSPAHYLAVPGIEAIDVCEHFSFCRGNALKYLWRAGLKGDELEDLKKSRWYLDREIARFEHLHELDAHGASSTDDTDMVTHRFSGEAHGQLFDCEARGCRRPLRWI